MLLQTAKCLNQLLTEVLVKDRQCCHTSDSLPGETGLFAVPQEQLWLALVLNLCFLCVILISRENREVKKTLSAGISTRTRGGHKGHGIES